MDLLNMIGGGAQQIGGSAMDLLRTLAMGGPNGAAPTAGNPAEQIPGANQDYARQQAQLNYANNMNAATTAGMPWYAAGNAAQAKTNDQYTNDLQDSAKILDVARQSREAAQARARYPDILAQSAQELGLTPAQKAALAVMPADQGIAELGKIATLKSQNAAQRYVITPTAGGYVMFDKMTGQSQFTKTDPTGKYEHVILNNGNIGAFDARTGSTVDTGVKGVKPGSGSNSGLVDGGLDPRFEKQVQAILAYRAPPQNAMSRGPGAAIMAEVYSRDPTYDAGSFAVKNKTLNSFMSGADGKQLDAVNTAVQHLSLLRDLTEALRNGDAQMVNQAKQAWYKATGSSAPTNFDAVANVAAGEVNKVAVGGPGASEDRELARAATAVKQSPQQISEGIDNLQALMSGRLNSVALRYKNGTKLDNFEHLLSPETREVLSKHGYVPGGAPAASPQPAPLGAPAPKPSSPSAPQVNSKGWALHTDAKGHMAYVSPDGKQFEEVK